MPQRVRRDHGVTEPALCYEDFKEGPLVSGLAAEEFESSAEDLSVQFKFPEVLAAGQDVQLAAVHDVDASSTAGDRAFVVQVGLAVTGDPGCLDGAAGRCGQRIGLNSPSRKCLAALKHEVPVHRTVSAVSVNHETAHALMIPAMRAILYFGFRIERQERFGCRCLWLIADS